MPDQHQSEVYPDGLDEHNAQLSWSARYQGVIALVIIGALILLALTGLLGGGKSPAQAVATPQAEMVVTMPKVMRSGLMFETRIEVAARQPIAKPVIAVDGTLWRDMALTSQYPDSSEQGFKDGAFTFDYHALNAGDRLEVKLDGQLNPPLIGGTAGKIELRDGERPILSLPAEIKVLP